MFKFLNHPKVTAIATLLGFVGFGLGIYFYVASIQKRELSYYVSRTKARVVEAANLGSRLKVMDGDTVISNDVTALQILLINVGDLPIKPEHVLDEITIETVPPTRILEINEITNSRSQIGIILSTGETSVLCKWRIIEKNDFAIFQLLVAGPPSTNLRVKGALEGQKEITELSRDELYPTLRKKPWIIPLFIMAAFAVLSGSGYVIKISRSLLRKIRKSNPELRHADTIEHLLWNLENFYFALSFITPLTVGLVWLVQNLIMKAPFRNFW
jgi:hypothetical protein